MNHYGKASKDLWEFFAHQLSALTDQSVVVKKNLESAWTTAIQNGVKQLIESLPKKRQKVHKLSEYERLNLDTIQRQKHLCGIGNGGMRKFPAIVPICVLMVAGVGLGLVLGVRTAIKHPEVSLRRKSNPEPWNEYKNKKYKLVNLSGDEVYAKGCPAPEY